MKVKILIYIICIVLIIAATVFIFYRGPNSHVDAPEIALPSAPVSSSSDDVSGGSKKDLPRAEITTATVQAAISTLSRPSSYSRQLTVESFWDGGSSRSDISVWIKGDNIRIAEELTSSVKNILITDSRIWIWYSDSGDIYTALLSGELPAAADRYQRLYTYEDILSLSPSEISDTGYVDYNGELCIFVEYGDGLLGYTNRAHISVGNGLLVGFESIDQSGAVIYRMSSGSTDISTPDDSLFLPPQ